MNTFEESFAKVISHISPEYFQLPNTQREDSYFPRYLKALLSNYSLNYRKNLLAHVDNVVPFDSGNSNVVITKIDNLIEGISKTVDLYFEGKVADASACFFSALDEILYSRIYESTEVAIDEKRTFYRARTNSGTHFSRRDLFHVDFKHRHIVSTNRYSIPGFPALYLGDSTYVCWEEFNQWRLRDLWFSRFETQSKLRVIKIQRIDDFLVELESVPGIFKLTDLLRYLITFPLSLACTIKVKHPSGSFKPEYIIPQLLLEYISKNPKIDGIKFPSTRVDYSRLHGVNAYNYVFPVKRIRESGFCTTLEDKFFLTEPTSLELEEIMYNPPVGFTFIGDDSLFDGRKIELISGHEALYYNTSFGKIEDNLLKRPVASVNYACH